MKIISNLSFKRQCLQTLFYRIFFLNELTDISKGKQLEWFHLGLCWHYIRSILLFYCVDIGPQSPTFSIPAVNSIWELFHRLALFPKRRLFHGRLSRLEETEPNESQMCKKKKTPHLFLPPPVFSPSSLFDFSQIYEGSIFFFFCSFSLWGNAIHCRPSDYWHGFVCMYYIILLLMTDEYTELFLFCYISYIYINISILKCLQ